MQITTRSVVLTAVACGALVTMSAPGAAAAPKRITGKLSKGGYDVIALAANGKAASARAKPRFRLRPRAKRVTLHLRARDGTYAGPVVVARQRRGKRAVVGVRAGAKLGKVKVRRGYAKAKLRKKWRDPKRWARARKGVPIGAGNFGLVRSKLRRASSPGDRDLDGIPNVLDVDDDGDLVLDIVDRRRGRVRRVAGGPVGAGAASPSEFNVASVLDVPLEATANANAGSTDAEIDSASPDWGWMSIGILPGDTAELDCGGAPDPANPDGWIGGLVYCTRGGTGRAMALPTFEGPDGPEHPAFPECCDPDGDGFGSLVLSTDPPTREMFLQHRATVAQFGTGDLLIQRVTTDGAESQFAATVPFAFATVPALVSYGDTAGNSATLEYPITGSEPGPGSPGTEDSPLPAGPGPNGDVVLTLTFWRPQRRPIGSESGEWTDIGGLRHSANITLPGGGAPQGEPDCPRGAYIEADPPDPELAPASPSPFTTATGFSDLAPDRPASAANTFTYRLNVTNCLRGVPWDPGGLVGLRFQATNEPPVTAHTEQGAIWFERK